MKDFISGREVRVAVETSMKYAAHPLSSVY
jgi:hypothetical protein